VAVLIAINFAVFFWEETKFNNVVSRFGMLPVGVHYQHQWYRLITSAFLHEGWTHILLNMLSLAIIGPAVEAALGTARFVALYLLAAVGGSVGAYLLTKPGEYGIGASGAIFGIMGAYYVLARSRGLDMSSITGLIVINLVISFVIPGISWEAHLGGLITGTAVCFGLDHLSLRARTSGGRSSVGAEIAGGAAVVAAAMVVLTLLALLPPGHANLS
jgi:membrane associated rhomboid family serine protease